MCKIISKLKLSAKHKHQNIAYNSIGQITYDNQRQRQADIFWVEYLTELAVSISYVHQQQCIKTEKTAEKDVIQQTAEKSGQKSFFLTTHKSK